MQQRLSSSESVSWKKLSGECCQENHASLCLYGGGNGESRGQEESWIADYSLLAGLQASSYLGRMLAPSPIANAQHAIWLLVPVHNRRATTKRCLAHLNELGIRAWANVLVIEDGSTDRTAEMLNADFPWVHAVSGDGSLWWAGAIRLGMETALTAGAECVCWLNDDSLPQPGSLERLVHLALENKAICGGVCRTPDGAFVYSGGNIKHRWPRHPASVPQPTAPPRRVEWLHGNMVAIPATVYARIGLPEGRWIKHNFADVDFTFRAHRAGIPVLLVPSALGVADRNDTASYWSWADARLSWLAIMRGFGSPKVWWYAPGLVRFKICHFGLLGAADCGWLFCKALAIIIFKCLPTQWLTSISRKIRN
jgi:GT2 family glycosyltransferase